MKKTGLHRAFTLIEILVIIAILSITILGTVQIDFKTSSDKQKLEIFTNQVISNIETVRNYSLLGKGVGSGQTVPNQWRITFDATGSGEINFAYSTGAWVAFSEFDILTASKPHYSIDNFKCYDINGTELNSFSGSDSSLIYISGRELSLTGACNTNSQILNFQTNLKQQSQTVEFNTLNGLLNIKK